MRKIKLFGVLTIFTFILSSCAFHSGMMTGNAALTTNNYKLVKIASGTASTTKIFGIGGLAKDALVLSAKKDMMQNNPLKDGQALANVTVDFKYSSFVIVMKEKVTVSADIIEFE